MNKENNGRIIGGTEDIAYEHVKDFFDKLGSDPNVNHDYNRVICLDGNTEAAIERDQHTKAKISEILELSAAKNVLDVGCGIGRFGEFFCSRGFRYVGVDGSPKMIERAKENLKEYVDQTALIAGDICRLEDVLESAGETEKFDLVFVYGVFMYLNDSDLQTVLASIKKLMSAKSQICIIESMSEEKRLTLDDFYSEDLKSNYSAIYRTVSEFIDMMEKAFSTNFTLIRNELMDYKDGLQKKREHVTLEHCIIWQSK